MASDLTAGTADRRPASPAHRPRRLWIILLAVGVISILAGVALVVGPVWGVFQRGQHDQTALNNWQHSLTGPNSVGGNADAHHTIGCGSPSPTDYALVTFGTPAQYHYAGVAGNGTWALLDQRSMVHYQGTADPGGQGNVIIAFHREPDYEHINMLGVGGLITIQDKSCHTYVYRVTARWDLPPSQVTQLGPTSGHELTMITCDPWWQDYDRLVWRAELVSPAGGGSTSPASGGSVGQPTF